ncbi:hypothetical protein ACFFQW_22120 [Umezawaea endophytica]|uniref:Uncharacterized protein n=1 Tax=Umezawaea endophytica TaxID=1654476 RepID=A0A9X2VIU5_9PSEU|nr:hypothetical protein [Umezawaea endophytica]MCS7477445.1 hypothetical protein [Umezawaea endophytica]
MNEDEVKSALHGVMVASSPPPPMDPGLAVEAGRKAHRRRRATWAGGVAGLAVVGIAAGAALLPGAMSSGPLEAANGGSQPAGDSRPAAEQGGGVVGEPQVKSSETLWPDGQTDRTATSGPRATKSVDMVPVLAGAVPSGLSVTGGASGVSVNTQSQFEEYTATGGQVWEYVVTAPVVNTDGSGAVGTLFAEVTTAGNTFPTGACEVTERSWGIKGTCRVVDVDGKKVGVLTSDGTEKRFDQLAAYRHDDGTVVFVAQAKAFREDIPALAAAPLTEDQLVKLATDPKFHLD